MNNKKNLIKSRKEPKIFITLEAAIEHIRYSKKGRLIKYAKNLGAYEAIQEEIQDDKNLSLAVLTAELEATGFAEGLDFCARALAKALIRDGFDKKSEEVSEALYLIEAILVTSNEEISGSLVLTH